MTEPLETPIDTRFYKFTKGLPQNDVATIISILKGRSDNNKKDRLILMILETDAQKSAYQDWKKLEGKPVTEATEDWRGSVVVRPPTCRGTKLSNGTRGIKLGDMSLSRETKERCRTEEEEKEEDEDEENESDSEKEIPKKEKTSSQRDLETYNELTDFSKLREIVDSLSFQQATFSKTAVACSRECESIFTQLKDNYEQFAAEAMCMNTRHAETRVNDDIDRLLAVMNVKQTEQEELKQERWQILDLCAEIRIHIKYKSPTMPADSFRMYLIRLIEDVESKQRQGGSFPEIVRDLQSVLEYYERKVVEVGDAVEKKTMNILTEYEIEGKLLDLRRLKHYGKVLRV